jgi:hypothetical protein
MSNGQGILRRFNDAGIAEFVRRIELLRAGGTAAIDDDLVTDGKLTEPIVPQVQLERPAFKTKRDAGEYLSERTRAARAACGDDDRGLWTWLSAWHWDAISQCQDGVARVPSTFFYVYGHQNHQNTKKHLIAVAVRVYELPQKSRLLLDAPVNTLPAVVKEVVTRTTLMRLRSVPELLDLLYLDPVRKRPKPGAVSPTAIKPGDLCHRLPARIRQLEVTHDLTNLTAEQLLNLLGDEFRQWAVAPAEPPATSRPPRRQAGSPPAVPPGAAQGTPS